MTLTSEFFRRTDTGALASAVAFVLLGGTSFAQGVQHYSGPQNGGSATYEGTGTRGGTDVDGAGPGGPRAKPLQAPYNAPSNYNYPTTTPGIATVPPGAPLPQQQDPNDPNQNQHWMRGSDKG